MMKYLGKKILITFILLGLCGMLVEVFFTSITHTSTVHKYISLVGTTSLWSLLVYGTGGLVLSRVNNVERFYKMSMRLQALIGGLLFTLTELFWGIILNLLLGLNIWHYIGFGNFLGQIDVLHSICWILGTPFFIWIYDTVIDYGVFRKQDYVYSIFDNYKELFTI